MVHHIRHSGKIYLKSVTSSILALCYVILESPRRRPHFRRCTETERGEGLHDIITDTVVDDGSLSTKRLVDGIPLHVKLD